MARTRRPTIAARPSRRVDVAQTRRRLVLCAPGKINLDLRILNRRPDGFHEVRTLLQSIALHDTLTLTLRPGPLTVSCRAVGVPTDQRNLIWVAAALLWEALGQSGEPRGVAISVRKGVPVAAGLGGGSSDAAVILLGLCRLWGVELSADRLRRLAAAIGSDVPFFLKGGLAEGTGRGERLRSLPDLRSHWMVVALPRFGVSSRDAYRWLDQARAADGHTDGGRRPRGWRHRLPLLANDLQTVVTRRHPSLGQMLDALSAAGALRAAMSGSGSAVYGLFPDRRSAARAQRTVSRPGWRTIVTQTTSRAHHARMVRPRNR